MVEKTYELESGQKKEPWPKSILFIISNEFCERFTFYGMRTILVLYFVQIMGYSDNKATQAFHIFAMACYFTPVIGAIIADSLLGKFWTILSISCVYSLGSIVLSIASINGGVALTFIGLGLIAFGTGGIKPCVSAFGGDQFGPTQGAQLATFFSMFYVSINAGSLISTSLTPILRSDVHCFDKESCFPLAFGVPAILMIVAVGFFILGKFLTNYIIVPPGKGNVLLTVCMIVFYSLTNRRGGKRQHWLDYADDKYEPKTISDVKILMQILYLYIPLPIFWALFDQQSSRWTLQAVQMDGSLGGWAIKPDQIQVVNPLLVIAMVPVFEFFIYPAMDKYTSFNRPLKKMVIGGLLAALAFIICGFFQIAIETNLPNDLSSGNTHMGFLNGLKCTVEIEKFGAKIEPEKFGFILEDKKFDVRDKFEVKISGDDPSCKAGPHPVSPSYDLTESVPESVVFYLTEDIYDGKIMVAPYENMLVKPKHGGANMFLLLDIENFMPIAERKEAFTSTGVKDNLEIKETAPMNNRNTFSYLLPYEPIFTNDKIQLFVSVEGKETKIGDALELKQGAGYVGLVSGRYPDALKIKVADPIVKGNSVSVFFQVIQYFVITGAEIMFSITGLEFSYSQAPKSMKSVIQACWLLTVAFGNLLVAVVAELSFFKAQSLEFFFFAVLMIIDIGIFAVMAYYYKSIKPDDDEPAHVDTNETQLENMDKKGEPVINIDIKYE